MSAPRRRTVRQIAWDGPYPHQGQFIATPRPGAYWLIEATRLHRPGRGPVTGVTLSLLRHDAALPDGAVIHPASRVQQTDTTGPPRVRQLAGSGPTAVMQAAWRDPTDTTPNASRRPREIAGYRTYCPLRRMMKRHAPVTLAHIAAADLLRTAVDLAVIGLSPAPLGEAIGGAYGPKGGPSEAAITQAQAALAVSRALAPFTGRQVAMLSHVVLQNRSVPTWCAEHDPPLETKFEYGRLVALLDILVEHYRDDVDHYLKTEAMSGAA